MNTPEKIQSRINLLTKEINEHELQYGTDVEYYELCIKKWRLCMEYARLTEDSWRFKRYFKPDFLRKIVHCETSIEYIHRWGDL